MKLPVKQKTQFSLFYLFIALTVLFLIQGWLVAPRPVEIPMSRSSRCSARARSKRSP